MSNSSTLLCRTRTTIYLKLEHTIHILVSNSKAIASNLFKQDFFSNSEQNWLPNGTITYFLFSNSKRRTYLQFCVELKHLKHYLFRSWKFRIRIHMWNSNTSNDFIRKPWTILFEHLEQFYSNTSNEIFTSNSKPPIGTELGTSVLRRITS